MNDTESNFERRQIGNMGSDDMYAISEHANLSLAEDWRLQGITFLRTDPVPTEAHTVEELKAMGIVGVTLVIPKPDQIEQQ